jgi:iron complex transport system permease protein
MNLGRIAQGLFSNPMDPEAALFLSLRLPRVLMAALVGGLLAGAGCILQALLRNPLADPYLLGVSSGAALGAVGGMALGVLFPAPLAVAGAMAALVLVLLLARQGTGVHLAFLILAGAAVHSVASSAMTLVLLRANGRPEANGLYFWLLGSLAVLPWKSLAFTALLAGLLSALGLYAAPVMNLMALGPESARALGVSVHKVLWALLLLAAAMTGLAVTFNGMIPFVGLLVPAMARAAGGGDHRKAFPLSLYLGAVLTLTADALGRWALAPREIPTGVVTALVGMPFFLIILRRAKDSL